MENWLVKKVECLSSRCCAEGFLGGLEVWLSRPNVLDKKVLGAVSKLEGTISREWFEYLESESVTLEELLKRCTGVESEGSHCNYIVRALLPRKKQLEVAYELVVTDDRENAATFLRLSMPHCSGGQEKSDDIQRAWIHLHGSYRVVYSDVVEGSEDVGGVSCHTSPQLILFSHASNLSSPRLAEELSVPTSWEVFPSMDWLQDVLLPKLAQWTGDNQNGKPARPGKGLSLVPLDRYSMLYLKLKEKYGPSLVKNWPEGTDPLKFVYEDIAIATYLLLLWEQEREEIGEQRKQSFLDLGCGNGLLVYLLTMEGHRGRGVDLRARKTWPLFKDLAELQVATLSPSPRTVYPEDWLLGNHSDELTPWLPVIASRSSYETRFFVLPCCPWDFNKKFHRRVSGISQYSDYLDYIQEIGEVMGFKVQRDALRIPSSKRVCLVGRHRTYLPHQELNVDMCRQRYIDERCGSSMCGDSKEEWVEDFSPRESVEAVRNCTHLARGLAESITNVVGLKLLEQPTYVHCYCGFSRKSPSSPDSKCLHEGNLLAKDDPDIKVTQDSEGSRPEALLETSATEQNSSHMWNVGGKLMLSEVAGMFNGEVLKQLKKECGGLQTLLRNQHQVFRVQRGIVSIRNWADSCEGLKHTSSHKKPLVSSTSREQLFKTKPCWFYRFHPQGCPRTAENCLYAHGAADTKPRPDFKAIKHAI